MGRIALGVDPKAKPTRVYALINALRAANPGSIDRMTPARRSSAWARRSASRPLPAPTPTPRRRRRRGAAGAGAAGAARCGRRGRRAAGAAAARRRVPRRRPGLLQRALRRSGSARHDLVGEHEPRVEPRRRQDVGPACRTSNGVHVDFHDVWADPKDKNHIIVGNDGGAVRVVGRGQDVAALHEPAGDAVLSRRASTTRCRSTTCAAARRTTGRCAGRRARSTASASARATGTRSAAATASSRAAIRTIRTSSTRRRRTGAITRLDLRTGQSSGIRPRRERQCRRRGRRRRRAPVAAGGGRRWARRRRGGGGDRGERANWDAPYIISPHSPTRLYWGSNRVYRSDDRGDHWTPISPDLTRDLDPARDPDHGQGVGSGDDRRLQQRDDARSAHRVARRIAAARRADLRRHRRRQLCR